MDLPDLPAARLVEMLERLALMNGALTTRVWLESQSGQPAGGRAVSGVTVGPSDRPSTTSSPTGSPRSQDVERVDSTRAVLTGHPALAGLVDFVQV